jgi:hypothetical protein
MSKTYTPTPEDIAKREARKAEKAAKKAQVEANGGVPPPNPNAPKILKREWVDIADAKGEEEEKKEAGSVTVATWNMLAQTLVREYKKKDALPGRGFVITHDRSSTFGTCCR